MQVRDVHPCCSLSWGSREVGWDWVFYHLNQGPSSVLYGSKTPRAKKSSLQVRARSEKGDRQIVLAGQSGRSEVLKKWQGSVQILPASTHKNTLAWCVRKSLLETWPPDPARVLCFLVTATRSRNRGGFPHLVKGRHFLFPFSPS